MAAPTEKELEVLAKFNEETADLELEQLGEPFIESFLLRWIRAREMNIKRAKEMLSKSIEWRIENKIDGVLTWNPPIEFYKEFPFEIWGYDYSYLPTGFLHFGRWDVKKTVVEEKKRPDYVRFVDKLFEHIMDVLRRNSFTASRPITQFTIVVDMEGLQYKQLTSLETIDTLLENVKRFEANYPETLKRAIVINAPRIFSILFSILKPIITARTLAKVQIFDSNEEKWKLALLRAIPANQIPVKYGGTNQNVHCDFESLVEDFENRKFRAKDEGKSMVTVDAGSKFTLDTQIYELDSRIIWTFQTEENDIGFSIQFQDGSEVVPYEKFSSNVGEIKGTFECNNIGNYTLVFDNSYSRMRSKILHFLIQVVEPSDDDIQTHL